MPHLIIIGNGIAGITAAREVRKRTDWEITVISNESEYFFARTALMYIYMGHMTFENTKPYEDWFWEKNRIGRVTGYVTSINTDNRRVELQDGRSLSFDKLLISTGSKSNMFGWPGQDLPGVQGLYSIQDLELMEQNTKGISRAVIVGGGLIGVEVAEMLQSRNIPTTFLVREENFYDIVFPREEAQMLNRHIREHGIDLRLSTQLKEVLGGNNGRVRAVVTDSGEEIRCEFVALTVGVRPNIDMIQKTKVKTKKGVLVNEYLETNIPDVYAAGDCVEIETANGGSTRIEQLWYTGRLQGEAVAKTIYGERTKYDRGIPFNSAKFFDIEWQIYGDITNQQRAGQNSFYWEHSGGRLSVRIAYKEPGKEVIGFNVMGVRFRQEVCESWIREKRALDYVLPRLHEANFDPEFSRRFEHDIICHYNNQNPDSRLHLKRKPGILQSLIGRFSRATDANPSA
ncbi:NAD(P)/FAD-dependent oxidoreductase [bacterium]|nr:NAD(P)/FAD-dependent oxidoreductase [bacterium]